jgi:predicted RNA-binding Zn-ribbon protein involved in translation (DUF1610 family)
MVGGEDKPRKAKCPKCGEEIDCLIVMREVLVTETATWYGNELEYETIDEAPADSEYEDWCCPECDAILAHTREEAEKLMGVSR